MSHGTHVKTSCRTYEWVMVHMWMHMNESWYTNIWMSHGTHVNAEHMSESWNESWYTCECRTYKWVMVHMWMRHAKHKIEWCGPPIANGRTTYIDTSDVYQVTHMSGIQMCTMTHSYVCVLWLIHMHSHVYHDSFICSAWRPTYITMYAGPSHLYQSICRFKSLVLIQNKWRSSGHLYHSVCWSKSHILIYVSVLIQVTYIDTNNVYQVTYITMCADSGHLYHSVCWSKSHILVQITCIRSLTSLYMLIQVTYISINADASLLYWCKQVTCIRSLIPL